MSEATHTESYVIVVGVDLEADGEVALDTAFELAANTENSEIHALYVGAPIAIVGVGEPRRSYQLDALERAVVARRDLLKKRCPDAKFGRVALHCGVGDPAHFLVQLAASLDAELIVVGSHNRTGVKRFVLGSVAEKVVRHARCAVTVTRRKQHTAAAAHDGFKVEPPCVDCQAMRATSQGASMWCDRHAGAKYYSVAHRYIGSA